MDKKKVLAIILSVFLTISFASCGETGNQGSTNTPGTNTTPGNDTNKPTVAVTVKAQLKNGGAVGDMSFTLKGENGQEQKLTSGKDGTVQATLAVGTYAVSYEYETIPETYTPDTYTVEVATNTTELTLHFADNTPDGSAEKPFFIADSNTVSVTLEPGQELYYNYRGMASKKLEIKNKDISLSYDGTAYTPVNGVISVQLEPKIDTVLSFSLKNTSDSTVTTEMELISPAGSMENPILLTESSAKAQVPVDGSVWYQWIAKQNGVVMVTSGDESNNISMTNQTTNAVSSYTAGTYCEYITAAAGDKIVMNVSSLAAGEASSIAFAIAEYAGTKDAPIPVQKESVSMSFAQGAAITFSAKAGTVLTVKDENATVLYNGKTYPPDQSGVITVALEGGAGTTVTFTVTNTADTMNGIEFSVK